MLLSVLYTLTHCLCICMCFRSIHEHTCMRRHIHHTCTPYWDGNRANLPSTRMETKTAPGREPKYRNGVRGEPPWVLPPADEEHRGKEQMNI